MGEPCIIINVWNLKWQSNCFLCYTGLLNGQELCAQLGDIQDADAPTSAEECLGPRGPRHCEFVFFLHIPDDTLSSKTMLVLVLLALTLLHSFCLLLNKSGTATDYRCKCVEIIFSGEWSGGLLQVVKLHLGHRVICLDLFAKLLRRIKVNLFRPAPTFDLVTMTFNRNKTLQIFSFGIHVH
jgi:hypothetical protein